MENEKKQLEKQIKWALYALGIYTAALLLIKLVIIISENL